MSESIQLSSSHLVIKPEIAEAVFANSRSAYLSYKKDRNILLVSPSSNHWFPKLHESKESLIKDKDLSGTKSIGIRKMIIDHDLPSENRPLFYQVNEEKRFLKVIL